MPIDKVYILSEIRRIVRPMEEKVLAGRRSRINLDSRNQTGIRISGCDGVMHWRKLVMHLISFNLK